MSNEAKDHHQVVPFGVSVLEWAAKTFGPVALDRRERALRLLEEVLELAQTEGVEPEMARLVTERVFSRPAGDTAAELGAVVMTLEALAANLGIDPATVGQAEWQRVRALDPEWFARRHRAKIETGCAVNPDGGNPC